MQNGTGRDGHDDAALAAVGELSVKMAVRFSVLEDRIATLEAELAVALSRRPAA